MDWSRYRLLSAVLGASMGAFLGGQISAPTAATRLWFQVLLLAAIFVSFLLQRHLLASVESSITAHSTRMAQGITRGEPSAARVKAVYRFQPRKVAATVQHPVSTEAAHLTTLQVLPQFSAPRTVYALVPERYNIRKGEAAVVLLDRANPDVAVLDDRVDGHTLATINADPRWTNTQIAGLFLRQGGPATVIATVSGLLVAILIGQVFAYV